jgi:hypothetical protein
VGLELVVDEDAFGSVHGRILAGGGPPDPPVLAWAGARG